jgi:hypothetical protein
MPNTAIYCPGLDTEMQGNLDSLVYYKWVDKADVHVGGSLSLGRVDPQWKLYILCHGHAQLPLFSTKAGKWSAKELATLMLNDGFKNTHRSVELLVCHAGESITSEKASEQRMAIYHQFKDAKTAGNDVKAGKLAKKFDQVAAKGPKPSLFNHEGQVIPLCAQFVQELKNLGFQYVSVTGYKAPVCQYYAEGAGQVLLDLESKGGRWGEPATPEYTVKWL